jgi:hypothetical protein
MRRFMVPEESDDGSHRGAIGQLVRQGPRVAWKAAVEAVLVEVSAQASVPKHEGENRARNRRVEIIVAT